MRLIKNSDLPNAKRMKVKYKLISGTSLFYLHNEWQRTKINQKKLIRKEQSS